MVHRALAKSQLICGTKRTLAQKELKIADGAGLLFPTSDSIELAKVPPDSRPTQLVIIDGTWSQAKSLVNGLPQLSELPRYHLAPTEPGQYRIRLEPTDTSLSTVEATVAALKSLEPETADLDKLLVAFETMVQKQLEHPAVDESVHYSGGPISGETFNIPKQLGIDPEKIIVCYGEACYRESGQPRNVKRKPVYWCAENLGTGAEFSTAIKSENPITETFAKHLGLPPSEFQGAIELSEFYWRWIDFCGEAELLVAYNQGTFRLIEPIDGSQPPKFTLRSICFPDSIGFGKSLPELIEALGIGDCDTVDEIADPKSKGRAYRRMKSSIKLVRFLRRSLSAQSRA